MRVPLYRLPAQEAFHGYTPGVTLLPLPGVPEHGGGAHPVLSGRHVWRHSELCLQCAISGFPLHGKGGICLVLLKQIGLPLWHWQA